MQAPTTQPPKDGRVTLTEKEFARAVGISLTTCWALRKKNKLAHYKVGRRILYSPDHVMQFLASVEQHPKAA
jgi:excisionase family DNA binding protein